MTRQQKNDLLYITQYTNDMTDEQLFNRLDYMIENYELDFDLFIEIADLMVNTSDNINEKLFYKMTSASSNAVLENIIKILKAVDDEDINELDRLTNYRLKRMLYENNISDEHYFNKLADYDLKQNGINASCLSWVNDIPTNFEYAELDLYDRFTTMTTAEVIEKFFDKYY